MSLYSASLVTRRRVLERTGVLAAGATAIATASGSATAQPSASITFNDQESDGQSVVIASASTSVDARLLVVTGRSTVFRQLELEAGTEFSDRTIELTNPLQESQRIRAELRTADGTDTLLARDRALIAVGESLERARAAVQLPNGTAELIDPKPDAGFHFPYLLYRPRATPDTPRPLYIQTLNVPPSSAVTNRDELRTQVKRQGKGYLRSADQLAIPGIVPAFPRTPDDGPSHIQGLSLPSFRSDEYRRYTLEYISTEAFPAESLKRVDRQLLQMIDDARERLADEEYVLVDGVHMNGFSGSAQFVSRFALLHPGRVSAISVGGNGAYPLPRASFDGTQLPYPLGIADYQELTGRAFDTGRWTDINQFIYLGGEDTGEFPISIRYQERAIAVFGENRVEERLPITRSVYQDVGATATFRVYDGVGHETTAQTTEDVIQFHRSLLNGDRSPTATPSRPATQTSTPPGATTSTEAGADSPSPGEDSTATDTVSESLPGFGVGSALAGIVGGWYLFYHRTDSDQNPE